MTLAAYLRRCDLRRSQLVRGESGSMLIEFSLSVWALLLMAFLIFEFCMAIYTYSVLSNAAREGVRYAIVHGTDNRSCSGPSSGCGDSRRKQCHGGGQQLRRDFFSRYQRHDGNPFLAGWDLDPCQPGAGDDLLSLHTLYDSARLPCSADADHSRRTDRVLRVAYGLFFPESNPTA